MVRGWSAGWVAGWMLGFAGLVSAASAQSYLVDWGGDYMDQEASGHILNLGPETIIEDAAGQMIGVGFAHDDTQPKVPLSARYDRQKPSAVFYGMFQVMNPVVPEGGDPAKSLRSLAQVKALARRNAIGFGSVPVADGPGTEITGLVFWRKADFLTGGEGKIPWSKIQSLSVSILSINSRGGDGSVRFALRNGDTWYLSESEHKKGGIFTVHTTPWGEWKGVGAGFPLPELPTDFSTSEDQLTDITAVGVFFRCKSSTPGLSAVFSFNAFQAEAQP